MSATGQWGFLLCVLGLLGEAADPMRTEIKGGKYDRD